MEVSRMNLKETYGLFLFKMHSFGTAANITAESRALVPDKLGFEPHSVTPGAV